MFLLTSTLIFISTVVYECAAEQTLRCPLDSKRKHLQRVWCKRDENDHNCCVGLSFGSEVTELDGGSVRVRDDGGAFIVSVKSLSQGDGVYWCGYWNGSNTIIKLAETKFHNSMDFIWTVLRYVLFGLLLLSVILTHMCSRGRKAKE